MSKPLTEQIFKLIINEKYGRQKLIKEFNVTDKTAREWISITRYFANHNIPFTSDPLALPKTTAEYKINGNHFKIASFADWHIGSKACKKKEIQTFVKYAKDQGVDAFIAPGDLIDCFGVYRGQEFELEHIGIDEQLDVLCDLIPDLGKCFFITGNHEYVAYKKIGVNVGASLSSRRKDFTFLGAMDGNVTLNGIKCNLYHGGGSGAYAVSYKLQKKIESYVPGDKPRLLFAGHWHQQMEFTTRNVTAFHCGSFQGPTILSKTLCLPNVIGGWIHDILSENGEIKTIKNEFVFFY